MIFKAKDYAKYIDNNPIGVMKYEIIPKMKWYTPYGGLAPKYLSMGAPYLSYCRKMGLSHV